MTADVPSTSVVAAVMRRLHTATAWQLAGAVFNQGSTLLLGIVIANVLGREAYGSFAVVLTTILMLSGGAALGIPWTMTRAIAERRAHDRSGAAGVLALGIAATVGAGAVAALLALLLKDPIAERIVEQPQLALLIALGAPMIFFSMLNGILNAGLAGLEHFRYAAIGGIAGGTAYLALGAAGAMRLNLPGVFIGITSAAIIQSAVLALMLRRQTREHQLHFTQWPSQGERHGLLHLAIPAAVSGVLVTPALWIITSLIARQENGLTAVALFSAANTIRLLVMFVPHLVNGVTFSLLNHARGAADARTYRAMFWTNLGTVTALTAGGAIVATLLAPYILRLFGASFVEATPIVRVLLLAVIPEALAVSAAQIIHAHGKMWRALITMTLPQFATSILVTALLVGKRGAMAAAIGILIGNVVGLIAAAASAYSLGLAPAARGEVAA